MKYFIRRSAIIHPGKYFKAEDERTAFEKVQREMLDFVFNATINDLVVDITEEIEDMKERKSDEG